MDKNKQLEELRAYAYSPHPTSAMRDEMALKIHTGFSDPLGAVKYLREHQGDRSGWFRCDELEILLRLLQFRVDQEQRTTDAYRNHIISVNHLMTAADILPTDILHHNTRTIRVNLHIYGGIHPQYWSNHDRSNFIEMSNWEGSTEFLTEYPENAVTEVDYLSVSILHEDPYIYPYGFSYSRPLKDISRSMGKVILTKTSRVDYDRHSLNFQSTRNTTFDDSGGYFVQVDPGTALENRFCTYIQNNQSHSSLFLWATSFAVRYYRNTKTQLTVAWSRCTARC